MFSKFDKNGNLNMAIFCWNCSGHKHANMRSGMGKGHCVLIGTREYKGKETQYRFRCKSCKRETMWNNKSYVSQYAVR